MDDRLISIIDDDESLRLALVGLVRSLGYRASGFGSAEEFLNSGDIAASSCLITDIQMPGGMNGIELADRVLAKKPGMPILFMSGSAGEEQLHHTRYFGISEILPKPVRKAALAEALKKMLGMP